MKPKIIWIIISVIVLAVLISFPLFLNNKVEYKINIQGSTTVYPIIIRCADLFKKDCPEAGVTVTASGSGSGIAALLDGTADIAMSSRPLTEKEKKIIISKGLEIDRIIIGMDGIVIIVNPQNPLDQISIKQLCDIYTGKIADWKDLGLEPGKIVPVSRDIASGTFIVFKKRILGTEKLRSPIQLVTSNPAMVRSVAADKDTIGYTGLGFVDRSVKALAIDGCHPDPTSVEKGIYPISRLLFLFSLNNSSRFKKKFLELVLGPEGKHIIKQEGFIAAR